MFKILGLMILGIIIGYGLRRISFLRKVEVSISYTVFLLLFVLGVTIGSNRLIVDICSLLDGRQPYWLYLLL